MLKTLLGLFIVLVFANANYVYGTEKWRQAPFQQRADHQINVTLLADSLYILEASQVVTYTNNSPEPLSEIYFHLWPNAYKNNQTAYALEQIKNNKKTFLLPNARKGFIVVSNIKQGDVQLVASGLESEIALIKLSKPLAPGATTQISMDFMVQMPPFYSRMGANESMIAATQWYPKPAVYDVNGWNTMPYLDQGEFYSEFGSYDVKITVPASYEVAATGNLIELEAQERIKNYSNAWKNKEDAYKLQLRHMQQKGTRTVTYTIDNVHDFAWFASQSFTIVESTMQLPSGRVITNRLYTQGAAPKLAALTQMEESILYYSREVGDYPYDFCTVVIGDLIAGGGMEYPTITVCAQNNFEVILHEIGHNWFYGILATNERRFPWMDESINSYYEHKFFVDKNKNVNDVIVKMTQGSNTRGYYSMFGDKLLNLNMRRLGEDQAADLPADAYLSINYYSVIYGRAAHYFAYLKDYLGQQRFDSAMQYYFEKWKFKHPLPGDFIDAFSAFTGENLDWFLTELLPATGGTNFKITSAVRNADQSVSLALSNKTGIKIPLAIGMIDKNNKLQLAPFFVSPFVNDTVIIIQSKDVENMKLILIDPFHNLPENNRQFNKIKPPKKLTPADLAFLGENKEAAEKFKLPKTHSMPSLKLRFSPTPENQYTWDLNINPAVNYTTYSGIGLGLSFYNRLFPLKQFEYDLTAYYATRTNNLIGNGSVAWNILPKNKHIQRARVAFDVQRSDFRPNQYENTYNKFNPNVVVHFNHKGKLNQQFERTLRFDMIAIRSDKSSYYIKAADTSLLFNSAAFSNLFKLNYKQKNNHALTPQSIDFIVEGGQVDLHTDDANKFFSKAEVKYKFSYNQKGFNRKFKLQFNAGVFLLDRLQGDGIYKFRGSGNVGNFDYTYAETMLARNQSLSEDGLWGQQLITAGGDMRINGTSFIENNYVSLKLEQSLPLIPFLRVYADFSTAFSQTKSIPVFWVGGLSLVVIEDIFEIYFPAFYSQQFQDFYDLNSISRMKQLSFKIDLNYFYPRKNLEKFRPFFGF